MGEKRVGKGKERTETGTGRYTHRGRDVHTERRETDVLRIQKGANPHPPVTCRVEAVA